MIPFALKGLWDFIPKAAIAVLALALGCFLIAANVKVAGLKGQVTRITAERNTAIANYARCQANEVTLDAALSRQNAAVEALGAELIIRRMSTRRAAFFKSLSTFPTFGKGWMRRCLESEAKALEMAR